MDGMDGANKVKPRTDEQRAALATYAREWRKINGERVNRELRERYDSSKRKEWYKNNVEKARAAARKFMNSNKEKISEYRKTYWRSPKGNAATKDHDRRYLENPVNRMHVLAVNAFGRALKADLPFDQCLKDILKANPPTSCLCCGVDLDFKIYGKGFHARSPSLDRLEGPKGYVVGNAYILCWRCNSLKRNATIEDLELLLAYMKGHKSGD